MKLPIEEVNNFISGEDAVGSILLPLLLDNACKKDGYSNKAVNYSNRAFNHSIRAIYKTNCFKDHK